MGPVSDPDPSPAPAGQRDRIRRPAPPAPVPAARAPRPAQPAPDLSRPPTGGRAAVAEVAAGEAGSDGRASDAEVMRSTGSMAVATLISRITGFLRNTLIGITLGPAVASAFNVANTLPNLITEIVLGAVLTSLVVPVLVRAEREDPDRGEAFIRRLLTVALTLLGVVTVAAVAAAPVLTRVNLDADGEVNVVMSTAFAFLLLPQIIFYGVFALLMAVLNTKGVFKPGAWAPVANNVVAIATLLLYWALPGRLDPDRAVPVTDPQVLLLGLGTTLGVVVQAVILVPPLLRAGVNLRPLWGIDARIRQFAGMGVAIVAYVAISQSGYIVTTRIASLADAAAPTIYQQSWLLLQVPYGIIGVTLLTAIMPRLSRNASEGDDAAVVRDLAVGSKLTMLALIPVVAFFTVFGRQIANALFAYGRFPAEVADILGWTLSFSSFTLIPYALVLLHLRVFYAREEAWTPTFIIFGITVVKVLLSLLAPLVAAKPQLTVVLLGAANGFGFVAGAVIGVVLLHRTLGPLRGGEVLRTCLWAAGASAVGAPVAFVVEHLLGGPLGGFGSAGYVLRTAVAGVVFLGVTGVVLMRAPLPEVRTIAAVLARVPGLSRLAPAAEEAPEEVTEAVAAGAAGDAAALGADGVLASPLLPPMPTEAARPPRFVPGEMIRGGRFRLISAEGARPGMRFWRAMDNSGAGRREVGLVFVDAGRLPHPGITSAAAAQAMISAARGLGELAGPGLAEVTEVIPGRTEFIVVAEWVPGAALTAMASDRLNPEAAALAAAGLFDAVARAGEAGAALGLDGAERLRVSVDGTLTLAFPAPGVDAGPAADRAAAARVLEGLLDDCAAPTRAIRAAAAEAEEADPATTADRLREAAWAGSADGLSVEPEEARTPGTGRALAPARGTSRRRLWGIGGAAVGLVLVAALVATAVFAVLNRSEEAPLTPDSVRRGPGAVEDAVAQTATITRVAEWQPPNDDPLAGPDNPEAAPLAADGDPATAWSSSVYAAQFDPSPAGFKPGIGLLLEFKGPVRPGGVEILGSPGATVQILAIDSPDPVDVATLPLLGEAVLGEGPTAIPMRGAPASAHLLVWVSALPMPDAARINEITVTRK